jgi:hypothetical protein
VTNENVTLTVTGAAAGQYSLIVLSGAGTLTGNIYRTPSSPEIAVIEAQSNGESATVSILVTQPSVVGAITDIQFVAGAIDDMTDMPWCPTGSLPAGPPFLVNWNTGSTIGLFGYAIMCDTFATASATQVITDLTPTVPTLDAAAEPTCPTGYTLVVKYVEVVGGGKVSFCARYESPSAATMFLTQFNTGPACTSSESVVPGEGYLCYLLQTEP